MRVGVCNQTSSLDAGMACLAWLRYTQTYMYDVGGKVNVRTGNAS